MDFSFSSQFRMKLLMVLLRKKPGLLYGSDVRLCPQKVDHLYFNFRIVAIQDIDRGKRKHFFPLRAKYVGGISYITRERIHREPRGPHGYKDNAKHKKYAKRTSLSPLLLKGLDKWRCRRRIPRLIRHLV